MLENQININDIAYCHSISNESTRNDLLLIASEPALTPDGENVVLKIIESYELKKPIDAIFVSFDSSQKSGEVPLDFSKIILKQRGLNDKEATKVVNDMLINSGLSFAARSYCVESEKEVCLFPVDDFYYWAIYRDRLAKMVTNSGKIETAIALLEVSNPNEFPSGLLIQEMINMVRLEYTYDEVLILTTKFQNIDFKSHLLQFIDSNSTLTLITAIEWAKDFYDAGKARTVEISKKVLTTINNKQFNNSILILDLPWIESSLDILEKGHINLTLVKPKSFSMNSMLDCGGDILLLEKGDRINQRLVLNPSKDYSTRTEAIIKSDWLIKKMLSSSWAAAAHSLLWDSEKHNNPYDVQKIKQCLKLSFEYNTNNDYSYWLEAQLHMVDKNYFAAKKCIEKAMKLAPKNAEYWRAMGRIYRDTNKWNLSTIYLLYALHLNYKDGNLWGELGYQFIMNDKDTKATYCLMKGSEFENEYSIDLLRARIKLKKNSRFLNKINIKIQIRIVAWLFFLKRWIINIILFSSLSLGISFGLYRILYFFDFSDFKSNLIAFSIYIILLIPAIFLMFISLIGYWQAMKVLRGHYIKDPIFYFSSYFHLFVSLFLSSGLSILLCISFQKLLSFFFHGGWQIFITKLIFSLVPMIFFGLLSLSILSITKKFFDRYK